MSRKKDSVHTLELVDLKTKNKSLILTTNNPDDLWEVVEKFRESNNKAIFWYKLAVVSCVLVIVTQLILVAVR